jgi:hypothetical protein
MNNYNCKICNYITPLKSNYNRHILSNKHLQLELHHKLCVDKSKVNISQPKVNISQPKVNISQPKVNISQPKVNQGNLLCKYCNKTFGYKQSLSKHIKYTCKQNNDEDLKELVRLLNLQLEQQKSEAETYKAESKRQLENQQKQIDKLMDKLQVPQINNTLNNIQNNNIRLSYANTNVSHLTDADYRKSINSLLMCVKTLIGIVHLNPEHPENTNIYISNLKDKYIMVYTGDTWELKNRQYEMNSLYDNNEMLLTEWVNDHGTSDLRDKFNTYLERKKNSLHMIQEEIKLMLYNKRHLALSE